MAMSKQQQASVIICLAAVPIIPMHHGTHQRLAKLDNIFHEPKDVDLLVLYCEFTLGGQ